MKKLFTWVITGSLIFSMTTAFGQTGYWKELDGKTAPSKAEMAVHPDKYMLYTLQTGSLKQSLEKAGGDFDSGIRIQLPTPEGGFHSFVAWETPMMEAQLAAEFPEMKTYTASSTENPAITAKIDFTADGFRAMIYDGDKTYFIDPYSNLNDGYYMAFYANNLQGINQNFNCNLNQSSDLLHPEGEAVQIPENVAQKTTIQNGSVRHNYRLAMACTGEYAIVVTNGNPTPALLLSKIVSTVNRINGIYERELSVTFTLVGNEADLLYPDPATDPYSCNYNLNCLLTENQTNVTNVIGAGNYDIGHILCTAGGGLAGVAVTCTDNRKSMGASTSSGPDDFSTSLHEIGHQFSALHTFNANTGGCYNNGSESSAYEPGSGSTIMSYGGLCSPNNIFSSSDNYFSVASLIQINNYLTTNGSANGCGSMSSGLNSISIPQNLVRTYNIPNNTPFVLTADLITPSQANASISYNWEQYDLGNFGGTEADGGQATEGPIMRSYPPSDTNNIRSFPIDKILDDSYTGVGERLPEEGRTVRFKFTARSILQGWGSFATLDSVVKLNISSSQGPFRATGPSSNATLDPGDTIEVTWDAANTQQAPVNCHDVNIYLSLDGGQSFPVLLMGSTPNDGSTKVIIPDVYTTSGLIKVQGVGNVFYDVANGSLTINGSTGIKESYLKNHVKVYPNPASEVLHIDYTGKITAPVIVNMYDMTGRIIWSGQLSQQMTIPVGNLSRGNYQIQLINSKTAATATYPVSLK